MTILQQPLKQEKAPSRLERLCAAEGVKMTGQRRIIARLLEQAEDHPDVETLHRRALEIDPRIGLATVYRAVRLFEECGLLARHDFGRGRARYEVVPEIHHDHLVNIETGEVVEFRNEEIERLQRRIARELGFELKDHRLELYGIPLPKKNGE